MKFVNRNTASFLKLIQFFYKVNFNTTLTEISKCDIIKNKNGDDAMTASKLNVKTITLDIGLCSHVRLVHSSDNHVCLADLRDDERKRKLAKDRLKCFGKTAEELVDLFEQSVKYAADNGAVFLSTGDICDFISYACLDEAKTMLSVADSVFAVGNHEFSKYVGEAKEDDAYKNDSYRFVQSFFRNDLTFDSRTVNGLNIVTVDNSYYNFTMLQLEKLKAEAAKGLPILMAFHNPIFTSELYAYMVSELDNKLSYSVGCPDEYTSRNPFEKVPDSATKAFIEYMSSEPLIKAVLAGHVHRFFESGLHWKHEARQIIAGAGFEGYVTDITVK